MKLTVAAFVVLLVAGCSAAPHIYVTSTGGSIAVIDMETMEIEKTVEVSGGPWGIAASPWQPRVYVANFWGTSVVGIDTNTNTITRNIRCYFPWEIAVQPPVK